MKVFLYRHRKHIPIFLFCFVNSFFFSFVADSLFSRTNPSLPPLEAQNTPRYSVVLIVFCALYCDFFTLGFGTKPKYSKKHTLTHKTRVGTVWCS